MNKQPSILITHHPNPYAFTVHVRFNVQENIALKYIIEQIPGIEETLFHNKYEFMVLIGQLFDKEEVINLILQKIQEFTEEG